VFLAFDLANKQSFENQWLLASQLVVAALACRAIEPRDHAQDEASPRTSVAS
jgi:hypothetical protein